MFTHFVVQTILFLTSDTELLAKLRRKFEEYRKRCSYTAPEVDPHAHYKWQLLGQLLGTGRIDVEETRSRWAKCDWHHDPSFNDAIQVIEMYNSGNAAKVRGGTGLT